MALYDSADLLLRVKDRVPRPATDEALSDAQIYRYLGDSQRRVVELLAAHAPESVLGAPVKLVTADGGLTYSFGTDADAANLTPMGSIVLLVGPKGPPLLPGHDWDSSTDRFLFDGAKIRFPGGRSRTFTDGPYARFVTMPGLLDGSTAPTLLPKSARELLVYDAAAKCCERLGLDATPHILRFEQRWPELLLALKNQFSGSGLRAGGGGFAGWWTAGELGAPS